MNWQHDKRKRRQGWIASAVLALSACAAASPEQHVEVTCRDSLPSAATGPYRPPIICLAFADGSGTTGARSAAGKVPSKMKAISIDGRTYFVDAASDGPWPQRLKAQGQF